MQIKKYPRAQLEKFSKIFFELGLVLTLFIVYSLMEHKSFDNNNVKSLATIHMTDEIKEDIPIVQIKVITAPPKNIPTVIEKINIVQDDLKIEESIMESTETDESDAVTVEVRDIVEVEEAEEIVEDIPFILIEKVPIYPGCKGNNKELKDCFTKKITEYFGSKFNVNLATELGLSEGKKKIFVVFRVDQNGKVSDVKARAPHKVLETEVVSIISSLPKMTPGKQRGRAVGVSYSIPITFEVRQ
ncbi:energy transducer TonB [Polaribacter batillariae]|uniref:Energy transducer TonB n=1 Tax=Polaribacter batillariae TaxID=2808900 RepID=A0ABX7ST72_9FLAO|nr:energy transducer TonB [Polaribacter batillariae]QTD36555.1 energy transducer TonB [Polaribacter batillariae]